MDNIKMDPKAMTLNGHTLPMYVVNKTPFSYITQNTLVVSPQYIVHFIHYVLRLTYELLDGLIELMATLNHQEIAKQL